MRDPIEQLAELTWPIEKLIESFEALLLHTTLPRREVPLPAKPPLASTPDVLATFAWIRSAAAAVGFDVEPLAVLGSELDAFMHRASPALFLFAPGDALTNPLARIIVLARRQGSSCHVATPYGDVVRVSAAALDAMVLQFVSMRDVATESRIAETFAQQPAVARQLLHAMHQQRRIRMEAGGAVLLTLSPTRSALTHARNDGSMRHVAVLVTAVLLMYACTFGAWFWLSDVALSGRIDLGRITAWGILVMATVPLELAIAWAAGNVTLRIGIFLRRRLLEGTFRIPLETIRENGVGSSVTLVNEPEVLEEAVLTQGILTFSAGLDFIAAWTVIALGPSALERALEYAAVWAVAAWIVTRLVALTDQVAAGRGALTAELVDRLVGHRTRAVQQARARWHEGEDEPLAAYAAVSRRLDARRNQLRALARVWLVIGSASVFLHFVFDKGEGGIPLIGLVGVVLGQQAFTTFASLAPALALTRSSHRLLAPLLRAGFRGGEHVVDATVDISSFDADAPIIEGVDLDFEHRVGGRKILNEVGLTVRRGDHVLLRGPSGGGKSTLASVIAGLRRPTSGVLLVRGFDQHTLDGPSWRRIVASAPQFHENIIFSKTLAFNLLASRRWPAIPGDMEAAEELCRELGLGPLLDRMPAGIQQLVGSTGWQLSHGERSRVFIARALLQNAPLVILDESFGALDPETLRTTVDCVIRRSPSLLVIAHT